MPTIPHDQRQPQPGPTPSRWAELPDNLRERLSRNGIATASEWLALSAKQRGSVFGITKAMQRLATAAARGRP